MKRKILFFRLSLLLFFSILALYLNFQQVFTGTTAPGGRNIFVSAHNGFFSDTIPHLEFARSYFSGSVYIPHPLWHIFVKFFSLLCGIDISYSAVFVSSLILLVWGYLVYRILAYFLDNTLHGITPLTKEAILWGLTLSICFIGPMNIPWLNPFIVKGVGSPSLWHNVTLWTVKPFALLASFFTILAIRSSRIDHYLFALGSALLSLFAKPSFFIVFLPSITLMAIYKYRQEKKVWILILSLVLFGVAILYYQFTHTYGGKGIIFDPLGVWSLSSNNIPYSILMAIFFPLVYYRFSPYAKENDWLELSWIMTLLGIVIFSLFAEAGTRYSHGNFGWSYQVSLSLLYLYTIADFAKNFPLLSFKKKVLLGTIFFLQILVGVYYFSKILEGQHPIYIILLL
jgi:hypothetical protein